MGGCLDGCFSWNDTCCSCLTVYEPVEKCKFYKTADETEMDRLACLDSTSAVKYERGNKKYWLMDITDEFLRINAEDLEKICKFRQLAKQVESGDKQAIKDAMIMLGECI